MRKLSDRRLFWSPRSRFIQAHLFGKRVSTGYIDEKAASAWCDEQERKHSNPRYAAAAAATLGPGVVAYFAELRQRKSSDGTAKKETTLTGHLVRMWGKDLLLSRIDAKLVEELIAAREGEGASEITVSMLLGTLRGILKVARHHGLWRGELAEVMPIRYSKNHTPKKRAPSPAEAKALLAQLHRYRAAHVAYILATGCRISESFKARRKDVDVARNTVHIHGTKTSYADDDIPITSVSREWLTFALENAPGKDLLFSPWGKYWRDIRAACKRAEIAPVTPNDLRRAFGHWHKLAGAHIPDVARMLRHGDDKLAQTTYARLPGEELGRVVEKQLTAGTSELHSTHRQNSPNEDPMLSENTGNTSAPGRSRICDLSFRKASDNARSLAGKQAWNRRVYPTSTSDVHGVACANCGAIAGRVFRVVGSEVRRVS